MRTPEVKTYHRDIGLPALSFMPNGTRVTLLPSKHARSEALNDRYGAFVIPSTYVFDHNHIVEMEVTDGKISKLVLRVPFFNIAGRDLILVVLRDGPWALFVKTVWSNLTTDNHKTLDRSRYASPMRHGNSPGC